MNRHDTSKRMCSRCSKPIEGRAYILNTNRFHEACYRGWNVPIPRKKQQDLKNIKQA